jgi:hypothetical protein
MGWGETGKPKPIEDAILAAKDFINTLAPQDLVGVIRFSDKAVTVQDLTTDRGVVTSALESLTPEGDTALYDAIVEGVDLLKNRGERRVIILLTDGVDSGISEFLLSEALDEATRWAVQVYPIGFGGVDQQELEQIAALTGGAAQIKPDSTELQTAFTTVLSILREQYLLKIASSLPADGNEHELRVTVDYESWHVDHTRQFIAHPGEVTITFPDLQDGQVVGGNIFFAPDILAPGTPQQMEIFMDQQLLTTVHEAAPSYTWDSTTVAAGTYEFSFVVEDSAGNVGDTSLNLQVRPPITITLSEPSEGQEIRLATKITSQVSSLAKVARVECKIDGRVVDNLENPPEQDFSHEVTWNLIGVSPGLHQIEVSALDVNGFSDVQQIKVIVGEIPVIGGGMLGIVILLAVVVLFVFLVLALRSRRRKQVAQSPTPAIQEGGASRGGILREIEGLNP